VKFTAEYDLKREYDRLSRIISAGVALTGGLGILVLGSIWLARDPLFHFLKIPEHLLADAASALALIMATVLLKITLGRVFQILEGLQRMDLRYKMGILASAVDFTVAISLLLAGYGLPALATGYVCGQILATSLGWFLCNRLCPSLRLSPFLISRDAIRELVSLAGRFQLSSLLGMGFLNGLNVVISNLCGTSLFAVFELARKLLKLARTSSGALIAPLMSAFANLHSAKDTKRWRDLYVMSFKAVVFAAVVSYCSLVVFADRIILAWTGNEYDLAAWSIRTMFIGYFVNILTGVGIASLRGQGTVKLEIRYQIRTIVLTAVTIFPAYHWAGFKGVIVALTVSNVAASAWFLVVYSRQQGAFVRDLAKVVLRSSVIGGVLIGGALLLRPLADQLVPAWSLRWSAVFEVAVWGLLLSLLTGLASWYAIFPKAERQYLAQKVWRDPRKLIQLV